MAKGTSGAGRQPYPGKLPPPLSRCPDDSLTARRVDVDRLACAAVMAVAQRILDSCSSDLEMTVGHLLKSMKTAHESIVLLLVKGHEEHCVDILPLVRIQVERVFVALMLKDDPAKWLPVYRKNAWKAFATKFMRDKELLGHCGSFADYYRTYETKVIDEFGKLVGVTSDEIATLRAQVRGGVVAPPAQDSKIPDMPTPGKVAASLIDSRLKKLAELMYPVYNELCHYTHGGFLGVMAATILRGDLSHANQEARDRFFNYQVPENLLRSHVSMLLAASLFATTYKCDSNLMGKLTLAWSPYHSDGSALGVAVWDCWVKDALGAIQ